ncbi:pyridoxal 5'-phosphate synthase glutaminase subunit PdxT [Corynebacterium pacaense]|uniref:pyridoxal 5'-phosphate synthase glutaminase subunit PdxT n=1 Tax=Corynebacterium pacaense TaxID=1816684 RepID=UPI0009B953CE|nr:pyridoxal 5'-phosphate synthase glutaminase subunit PdxT [Corynebacterium pacaense]
MIIGVLALQGGYSEHMQLLAGLGADTRRVRVPADLEGIDGVVLPGGESTVMDKLARSLGLAEPLATAIVGGLPVLATCAGLIYLARGVENPAMGQQTLGVLDIRVRRNAFGSQRNSFDTSVKIMDPSLELAEVEASFIRAPVVTEVGEHASAFATLSDGSIVGVRQDSILALSFHPEVTADSSLHRRWLEMIEQQVA